MKKTFKCVKCETDFSKPQLLIEHIENQHSNGTENKNECDLCDKSFYNQHVLKKHVKNMHSAAIGRNNCQLCGKTFFSFQKNGKTYAENS